MRSNLRACAVGLVVTLGGLMAASPAWAMGTWAYPSTDHTQLQIRFQTDDGASAYYEVFLLSVAVASATCPGGGPGAVGQPDNNPNEFECQISPPAAGGTVTAKTSSAMTCSAQITNQASLDNVTYSSQRPITAASGNCPAPPVASFTSSPSPAAVGNPVSFDASASSDPNSGGSITGYGWNFGDGSSAGSGAKPSHTYSAAGTYTVTLTVTDSEGGTATTGHSVTIGGASAQPVASFTASPSPAMAGSPISFDASASSDPNSGGSITGYGWNFGDGSSAGSGVKPSHTYSAAGTYTVTLTVTDSEGGTASTSHSVTISKVNSPPVASFTASPSPVTAGTPVSFDASASSDPNGGGSITGYGWNFGDGSPLASGIKVPHTYTSPASYTVTLWVTDSEGDTSSTSQTVTVAARSAGPPPVNTALPQISGDALFENLQTASPGSWMNDPTSFAYEWQICDADGLNCNDTGATDPAYQPEGDALGRRLRVVVTATNAGGSATATSPPSPVIQSQITVGSASTNGPSVTLPVECSAPGAGLNPTCDFLILLAVLAGGQPSPGHAQDIALSASCGHVKPCPKPLIVGSMAVKVRARHSAKVRITLNRAGRQLLAKKRILKVRLTVSEGGRVLLTRTIVFRAKPVKKHR